MSTTATRSAQDSERLRLLATALRDAAGTVAPRGDCPQANLMIRARMLYTAVYLAVRRETRPLHPDLHVLATDALAEVRRHVEGEAPRRADLTLREYLERQTYRWLPGEVVTALRDTADALYTRATAIEADAEATSR